MTTLMIIHYFSGYIKPKIIIPSINLLSGAINGMYYAKRSTKDVTKEGTSCTKK